MKFLNSPSSSSSASDYSPAGCVPAILRRLLRLHTLPTFPLDNHSNHNEFDEPYCANKPKGDPGIVGKLMGLDSMPEVNPIDNWRELKLKKKGGYVLKAPVFVELENDKFIILSFEGDGKDKELESGFSKNQKGKSRIKLNQELVNCHGEVMGSCKLSNLGKNYKKACNTECDSENSSPVSVLEFSGNQEASYSGKDESQSKNSNSRRKLRGDLDKNAPSPLSSSSSPLSSSTSSCNSVDDGEELCRNDKEYVGFEKKSFVSGESKEMWDEICKMAERDVIERWKGEDFGEIGVCLGLQILDQLILELFTVT
ncbi:uncharacterized protein LOC143607450 [Bidens hawaiensis]|uniref:uncharacterized protein LOC143607450 n=1 Tax=Bidens hawaiensis TaxID=980011 RepID=UPI00404A79E9